MKQLAMLLVAGVMAFTLAACGEDQQRQPRAEDNGAAVQPAGNEARPVNEAKPMNNNEQKPASDAANGQESQY